MNISEIDFMNKISTFPVTLEKIIVESVEPKYIALLSYKIVLPESDSEIYKKDSCIIFCNGYDDGVTQGFSISIDHELVFKRAWQWQTIRRFSDNQPGQIKICTEAWRAALFERFIGTTIAPGLYER